MPGRACPFKIENPKSKIEKLQSLVTAVFSPLRGRHGSVERAFSCQLAHEEHEPVCGECARLDVAVRLDRLDDRSARGPSARVRASGAGERCAARARCPRRPRRPLEQATSFESLSMSPVRPTQTTRGAPVSGERAEPPGDEFHRSRLNRAGAHRVARLRYRVVFHVAQELHCQVDVARLGPLHVGPGLAQLPWTRSRIPGRPPGPQSP